jgi:hypothetical protein
VPAAEIVTVIALAHRTGLITPILKVRGGVRATVFMISGWRAGAVLESAPSGAVTVSKLGGSSTLVGQVTGDEDRAGYFFDEFGGGLSAIKGFATSDVSRPDERKRLILIALLARRRSPCGLDGRLGLAGGDSLKGQPKDGVAEDASNPAHQIVTAHP